MDQLTTPPLSTGEYQYFMYFNNLNLSLGSVDDILVIQSALVISRTKGFSEIL